MSSNSVLKKSNPYSPGRRTFIRVEKPSSKNNKYKPLCSPLGSACGRSGSISVRHKSNGNKKLYRQVEFSRSIFEIPAVIQDIQYDPNRSAFISLLKYETGEYAYMIAVKDLKIGDAVITSRSAIGNEITTGNRFPLSQIPIGTSVNCVEAKPGKSAQIARSAGSCAIVAGTDGIYTILQLPSKEKKKYLSDCMATIGIVSNEDHENRSEGKAGRNRWKGKRPTVRGEAMNPVDHPHGGRTRGGIVTKSPSGLRKGTKTRKIKKDKNKKSMIVSRRKK